MITSPTDRDKFHDAQAGEQLSGVLLAFMYTSYALNARKNHVAADFVGAVLLMSILDMSQPWRLYLFVLMYGLGMACLGPISRGRGFPGRQWATILTLSFCRMVAAIALSSACLGLAAPRKARVMRS
jgi:hypothetical protein